VILQKRMIISVYKKLNVELLLLDWIESIRTNNVELFCVHVPASCPLFLAFWLLSFYRWKLILLGKEINSWIYEDWFLEINLGAGHRYLFTWFVERGSKFELWFLHQNGKAGLLVLKGGWLRKCVWHEICSRLWDLILIYSAMIVVDILEDMFPLFLSYQEIQLGLRSSPNVS